MAFRKMIGNIPRITRTAGETIDWKQWVIQSPSLTGDNWGLNLSKGEEIEQGESPILVKIKDGHLTVLYKGDVFRSGIMMEDPYFASDNFKNSITRVFRGLQTGKVSWTHLKETYDLQGKGTEKKEKDND